MKILLVDDDPQNLESLKELLENTPDNEARIATTGEQALAAAEEWGGVDLLITEIYLEPMNGFTLRNKVENHFAIAKTIFMARSDVSDYREHWEGYEVLTKPVDPNALLVAVAKTLAGRAPVSDEPAAATPVPAAQDAEKSEPLTEAAPAAPESEISPVENLSVSPPVAEPAPPPQAEPKPAAPMKPIKVASGAPKPAPVPRPTVSAPRLAVTDALIGQTIGNYRIVRKLGDGKWGTVYEAVQTSMDRPVAMKILSPGLQKNAEIKQQFMANASAKANVDHPHILSVYEADEADGHCYFTHEYVDGETLAQMTAQGRSIDDGTALQLVKIVAEGLSHLNQNKIAHSPLAADSIFVGHDKRPRLANLATVDNQHPNAQQEMQTLSDAVLAALPGGHASKPGLEPVLMRMRGSDANGFQSWQTLLQAVKTLEPKVVPVDAFKLSAKDAAAIRAVESARKRQTKQLLGSLAGLIVLLALAGTALWLKFRAEPVKSFEGELVKIPAGEFIYQDGQKITLPEFSIDKYEVTLGQYAKFVEFLKTNPTTQFDNPQQPKEKSHVPKDWEAYYGHASHPLEKYRNAHGVPIDLNCPVFLVDYWDAYAYAHWKGRRLPTEQEWEKAARGTDGRVYPWGNDWDEKKLNARGDFVEKPEPSLKPTVDGFIWWSPVDAVKSDLSPFGVVGMAGNVSEWTESRDPSGRFVIVRGGNFKSDAEDAKVTHRLNDVEPGRSFDSLGFRTVSGGEPPAASSATPQFRVSMPVSASPAQ